MQLFHFLVMIDMTNEGYVFDDVLEKIQTPLLCVWGEDDKVIFLLNPYAYIRVGWDRVYR